MRKKLVLLTSLFTVVTLCATFTSAQNPLAGVTKLHAEGVGTGTTGTASGTLTGDPMGFANWTMTFIGTPVQPNGQGGNCDFGSGNITLTAADGSTIQMQHGGLSCNTGVGGGSPAINNTVYIITSGTGRFSKATGAGNVAFGFYNVNDNPALAYIHFDGNIDLH